MEQNTGDETVSAITPLLLSTGHVNPTFFATDIPIY